MRIDFVLTWWKAAGLVLLGVIGALAVSFSGLVSIAASSGHFGPVGWFLHWTFDNAVRTQALLIEVPEDIDLSDPSLVQRSAGHFATGCAICHGAPGVPQSPVVLSMTPPPPPLAGLIHTWEDNELFWIVKHGIKYSGMPAWPALQREDEVWAQVAFLKALPGLNAADYAALALAADEAPPDAPASGGIGGGPEAEFETALADCARCHGRDGLGQGEGEAEGAFPAIAGQPETYLYATLRAFAFNLRQSGFMEPPAARYDDEMLRRLAEWYASRPTPPRPEAGAQTPPDGAALEAPSPVADATPRLSLPETDESVSSLVAPAAAAGPPETREGLLELGRRIALEGLPVRKIPACESCHGDEGRAKNPHYPYLGGQPEWYIDTHLHLWKEGERGGTPFAHIMDEIAIHLTEEQIEAVAAWYSEQPLGR